MQVGIVANGNNTLIHFKIAIENCVDISVGSRDYPDPEIPGFGQFFQSRNPGIEPSGSRDLETALKLTHFDKIREF